MNIALTGFMGTGKTSVSLALGKMTGMEVFETDRLIEEQAGMAIKEIFEKYGEPYFREIEENVVATFAEGRNCIISCGGGVVLNEKNVTALKISSRVILLEALPETILARVENSTERPILNNNMNTAFIEELMEKRKKFYNAAADIKIQTDALTIEEVAGEILRQIKKPL